MLAYGQLIFTMNQEKVIDTLYYYAGNRKSAQQFLQLIFTTRQAGYVHPSR